MCPHNEAFIDRVFMQLRSVIHSLGRGGGSMTPSIYETAQVLRFCPEHVETDKVTAWLLSCQQPDGGWGEARQPLYRIVPTLAAVLALRCQGTFGPLRKACLAGQRFLEEQDRPVEVSDGAYLPVAIELILPRLLDEIDDMGMGI